jgi:Lectin C-type domain
LWLSASDIGSTPGDFKWADATPVDSISWAVNNPNAFREGQETCVVLDMKDGRLRDWDCTKYYFVLCELPKQITAC